MTGTNTPEDRGCIHLLEERANQTELIGTKRACEDRPIPSGGKPGSNREAAEWAAVETAPYPVKRVSHGPPRSCGLF